MTNEAQRSEALGDACKYLITMRADQLELALACFSYVQNMLNEGTVLSAAHKMAGRFVYRRLNEMSESFTKQAAAELEAAPNTVVSGGESVRLDYVLGLPEKR